MKETINRRTWGLAAAVLLTAAAAVGCGGKTGETTPAQTESSAAVQTTEAAGMPNPMETAKDVNDFEKLGIHMVVPEEAGDVQYYTINGEVADIRFTLDDVNYTWRASNTAEDFAGIFERFKGNPATLEYDYGAGKVEAVVKTTESGGRLAEWTWGDTVYTLYTSQTVEDEAINSVVLELVELSRHEK